MPKSFVRQLFASQLGACGSLLSAFGASAFGVSAFCPSTFGVSAFCPSAFGVSAFGASAFHFSACQLFARQPLACQPFARQLLARQLFARQLSARLPCLSQLSRGPCSWAGAQGLSALAPAPRPWGKAAWKRSAAPVLPAQAGTRPAGRPSPPPAGEPVTPWLMPAGPPPARREEQSRPWRPSPHLLAAAGQLSAIAATIKGCVVKRGTTVVPVPFTPMFRSCSRLTNSSVTPAISCCARSAAPDRLRSRRARVLVIGAGGLARRCCFIWRPPGSARSASSTTTRCRCRTCSAR